MSSDPYTPGVLPKGHHLYEYELLRVLGFGGFGITYLGFDRNLDLAVAIKEYLPSDLALRTEDLDVAPKPSETCDDFQWGMDRFLHEARTLGRFDHRQIVKVYRFFESHGTAYIVMEYVEGETLASLLDREGTLGEADLRAILLPIMDGLETVHRADFLHRDIKPGNIVIRGEDGSPVLLDFGSARQAIGTVSRSVTSIVTPGYAPIEQYSIKGKQGPYTDIYALGGLCYRALTGSMPDDATDRVRSDLLVPLTDRCAGQASRAFLAAIDWALRMDETDRPQSIGAWRAALEGEKREDLVVDTAVGASLSESRPGDRSRARWAALFAGILLASVGAGGYLWWETMETRAGIGRYTKSFEAALERRDFFLAETYVDSIRSVYGESDGARKLYVRLAEERQAEVGRYAKMFGAAMGSGNFGLAEAYVESIRSVHSEADTVLALSDLLVTSRRLARIQRQEESRLLEETRRREEALRREEEVFANHAGRPSTGAVSSAISWTDLHLAAELNLPVLVLSLLDSGADVNGKDQTGLTPLHAATRANSIAVMETLLTRGAAVNAKNQAGWTPLHHASVKDYRDVGEILLNRGADVNAKNRAGWTPLHAASGRNAHAMVDLLLDSGADVNAKGNNGLTPLHVAAGDDAKDSAVVLLARSADVNAKDNSGLTPLHYAEVNKADDTANVIRSHGGLK